MGREASRLHLLKSPVTRKIPSGPFVKFVHWHVLISQLKQYSYSFSVIVSRKIRFTGITMHYAIPLISAYTKFKIFKTCKLICTFINRNKLVKCQNGEFVRLCNENGYKKIFFLFRFRFGFVINVVFVFFFLIYCCFLLCFWLCVAFYCSNSNDINDLNLLWFYAQTQTDPN